MEKPTYPRSLFYRKVVAAKMYLDCHFAESINIDDIASEASFSKYDFIRQFKKTYGYTPYRYLIRLRMEAAARLLADGVSVQQVCFDVGYDSISSFSTLFRKYHGITAKKYQIQQKERKESLLNTPRAHVPGCMRTMVFDRAKNETGES